LPFTPFHLGPGLFLGLLFRKRINIIIFIIANVIIDLEPFIMVILLRLNYPVHGYIHTFLAAVIVGLSLGYMLYLVKKPLRSIHEFFFNNIEYSDNVRACLLAGASGTVIHVLLDSPLYPDIKPFYPIAINPLYNPSLTMPIYMTCIICGGIGLIYYIYIWWTHE